MRGDMIEVFKIAHNFYDPQTTAKLLKFHSDPSTRSNGYKIVKVATNTTKFQHFFTNRVTNTWNSLPSHVVSAETINEFKNSLDQGGGGIRPPSDTMILTGNFSILGTTHPFAYQLVLTY